MSQIPYGIAAGGYQGGTGLREAWRAEGKKDQAGLRLHVAGFLQKSLGGKPRGGSPSAQAVGQLFQRMDDDPDGFPGKGYAEATPGPKRLLRGPTRRKNQKRNLPLSESDRGGITLSLFVCIVPEECPASTLPTVDVRQ